MAWRWHGRLWGVVGLLALGLQQAAAHRVGQLDLVPCGEALCGRLERALDPAGEVPGSIGIHFEFRPQRAPALPNAGTLVGIEGGPGYPSTGSRAAYLALFEPLRADRHVLLMDSRGTGRSSALRCPGLQADALFTPASVAACGRQLGPTAALFGSALAADDLAALIDALGLPAVDVYGDSYGTFLAQAFAGRHPARLRRLVLDGAYAVTGGDPWYPEATAQARLAFDLACARSPACAAQAGPSRDRIQALLGRLRVAPVSGTAPDGDGHLQPVTADARGLAYVMLSNASGPLVYRELDAAARAWEQGDTAPFLRLVAENQTAAVSGGQGTPPRWFSSALFAAVSCADYPQIFDAMAPPALRRAQAAAAIAARQRSDPAVYAPFTIDEFLSLPQDYSVLKLCLPWPAPSPQHPPGQPVPPGTEFPSVPVLVLSGEFDSLTPPAQGAQAAALFPQAQQVLVRNSFHVTALGDGDGCASGLAQRFLATGQLGDAGCAERLPPIRLLDRFARRAADLVPASAAAGDQGTVADHRAVVAAVQAAGDAVARWWVNYDGSGVGLRGGTFTVDSMAGATRFTLAAMQWTDDVTVSGTVVWDRRGQMTARLQVVGSGTSSGDLVARWPALGMAQAHVQGRLGGRRIVATMPAP